METQRRINTSATRFTARYKNPGCALSLSLVWSPSCCWTLMQCQIRGKRKRRVISFSVNLERKLLMCEGGREKPHHSEFLPWFPKERFIVICPVTTTTFQLVGPFQIHLTKKKEILQSCTKIPVNSVTVSSSVREKRSLFMLLLLKVKV